MNEAELKLLIEESNNHIYQSTLELANYYLKEGDEKKSFFYATRLVLSKKGESFRYLARYYEKGIGTIKDEKVAYELYERAYQLGDIIASYNLGVFNILARGTVRNIPKAKECFEEGSNHNHIPSIMALADLYETGKLGERDYSKSFELLLKSNELGNKKTYHRIGIYYFYGYGVEQDYKKAFQYFYDGALEGDEECNYYLGVMFSTGKGVEQDYAKAFYWYSKGATNEETRSMHNLGLYYIEGHYVVPDREKGLFWIRKSAEKGFIPSQQLLDKLNNNL